MSRKKVSKKLVDRILLQYLRLVGYIICYWTVDYDSYQRVNVYPLRHVFMVKQKLLKKKNNVEFRNVQYYMIDDKYSLKDKSTRSKKQK